MYNSQGPPNPGFYLPPDEPERYPKSSGYPPTAGSYPPMNSNYSQSPPAPAPPVFGEPYNQPFPDTTPYSTGNPEDPTNGDAKNFDFSDKTIRNGFIRKVYSILTCQLLITLGIMMLFILPGPIKKFVKGNMPFFWVVFVIAIIFLIFLICCDKIRRKSPMNFIFLFIFTLFEGMVLGIISAQTELQQVAVAIGLTALVCFALTCFALQTKWDFTGLGSVLCVLGVVLLVFGISSLFFPKFRIIYACLGVLLMSAYLIYDTQMLLGGKRKCSLSPEEYIYGALCLYLDIVNMFIHLLNIVSEFV